VGAFCPSQDSHIDQPVVPLPGRRYVFYTQPTKGFDWAKHKKINKAKKKTIQVKKLLFQAFHKNENNQINKAYEKNVISMLSVIC
jgi:hypothetical protein